MVNLYEPQLIALDKMKDGCVLCGGVGSGKSITSLAYYYMQMGGRRESLMGQAFKPLVDPLDLYIITTARKRDTFEWDQELSHFYLWTGENSNGNTVVIDSWNNIQKYQEVENAFFIFDEQRVIGSGAWVKAFLRICKSNRWILLSATPGDTWSDYIPVFIANGFYKNRTEFVREHVIYNPHVKFRKIERYINQGRLIRQRREILVEMDAQRRAESHHIDVFVEYDNILYKSVTRNRWNPYEDIPIKSGSELCYIWRRVVNESGDRIREYQEIQRAHDKIIVFYNFDYEREILLNINYGRGVQVAEWSGHKHEDIPNSEKWVYLVQYAAGAEGWNCTDTDTIVFYSQNYSYKVLVQAAGRIDRVTTPYDHLYYYHLKSKAPIDIAISAALKQKKNFNEKSYLSKGE